MAKSGTIAKTIRTGYQLKLVWTIGSQSAANNTSTVTVKVQLVSTGASYTINSSATKNGSLTINGTKYTFTFSAALSGSQTKTLFTKTVTIAHSADGSKTCAFSTTCGINVTLGGTYYGDVTASGSGTFDTIPRATTPTLSASSVNMGSSITINMPRAADAFTHTLTYKFGNATGTIGSGLGTSKAWTVPLTLASQIPSGTSGTCTITCKTYNGSTLIGTKTVSFKANVPASVVPTISAVSLTETVAGLAAQFGAFVQGKSKVKINIAAAGVYGSTIKTYKTTVDGKTLTGSAPTTGTMSSGTKTVTVTVTDSRGRTAKQTKTLTVIPYAAPAIRGMSATRSLADGTENYEGTNCKIGFAYAISTLGGKNTSKYVLEYKAKAATTWTKLKEGTGHVLSDTVITGAVMNIDSSYDVRLSITDYFGTVRKTVEVPTAFTLIDFNASGKAIAFGKVSERTSGIEFGMPAYFSNGETPEGAKVIQSGTDCNELLTSGFYCFSSAVLATMKNCPITSGASGAIIVIDMGDSGQKVQIAVRCSETGFQLWERCYYQTKWWGWFELVGFDTGWKEATLTSNFETYAGNAENALKYRRKGSVVHVKGVVTPKATLTGGTENVNITTLPAGYRPAVQQNFLCQGSGTAVWLCTVTAGGVVRFARYRTGDAWANAVVNTWLPIDISFILD